jgi:hypothetical protein
MKESPVLPFDWLAGFKLSERIWFVDQRSKLIFRSDQSFSVFGEQRPQSGTLIQAEKGRMLAHSLLLDHIEATEVVEDQRTVFGLPASRG